MAIHFSFTNHLELVRCPGYENLGDGFRICTGFFTFHKYHQQFSTKFGEGIKNYCVHINSLAVDYTPYFIC